MRARSYLSVDGILVVISVTRLGDFGISWSQILLQK